MNITELTDEELVDFYICANSYYEVKIYKSKNGEVGINNISEIIDEMKRRESEE
jgi:hypothetical protein